MNEKPTVNLCCAIILWETYITQGINSTRQTVRHAHAGRLTDRLRYRIDHINRQDNGQCHTLSIVLHTLLLHRKNSYIICARATAWASITRRRVAAALRPWGEDIAECGAHAHAPLMRYMLFASSVICSVHPHRGCLL